MFWIIHGQCAEVLKAQLKAEAPYSDIDKNQNPVELLKLIQTLVYSAQQGIHEQVTMSFQAHRIFRIMQNPSESLDLCIGKLVPPKKTSFTPTSTCRATSYVGSILCGNRPI